MVIASTVDRNAVSADSIQLRLNRLVEHVREALLNPEIKGSYMQATKTGTEDFAWCDRLPDEEIFYGSFTEFSGQGESTGTMKLRIRYWRVLKRSSWRDMAATGFGRVMLLGLLSWLDQEI